MKRICVFLCSENTYLECIQMNLFGSEKPWPMAVHTEDICCLYHYGVKKLFALWQAESDGAHGIVRSAWGGKFLFQVRVKLISTEIFEIPPMIANEFMDAEHNDFEGIIELGNTKNLDQLFSSFIKDV